MSKRQIFFSRLLSTIVLWTLVLGALLTGSEIGCLLVLCGLGFIGLWEYFAGLRGKQIAAFTGVGLSGGLLLLVGTFLSFSGLLGHGKGFALGVVAPEAEIGLLVLCVLAVLTSQLFLKNREPIPLSAAAFTLLGIVYVAWLFGFATKLIYFTPRDGAGHLTGQWYLLYLLVVAKFSDMGAYLTGSLIGKHPMVPHISPKKTWEGFAGALLFSTAGSFALLWLLGPKLHLLRPLDALVLGLGLGLAAVVGDLVESIVKRSLDLKDSGSLLPGIGGALDLIDSVLFTAPLLYYYLRLSELLIER
ncbi:MAG TPA: phosphatidate cytidylyltransferase [Chthoniobacteraceae bacterium]|jgi:phosphatidate cytidylyltransferase|nr:phosphatidate cytidylyltransferase [Chthoniobacteraceae bacterium]